MDGPTIKHMGIENPLAAALEKALLLKLKEHVRVEPKRVFFYRKVDESQPAWHDNSRYTGEALREIRKSGQSKECARRLRQRASQA